MNRGISFMSQFFGKTFYISICLLFFGGCVATMVVHPGQKNTSQYAPINETKRPGLIKYLNDGAAEIVKSRREDAYKQMYAACNGKYQITSEGTKADGGAIMPIGYAAVYANSNYIYIQFECVE